MLRKQLTDKQHMILSVHTLWLRLHIHHLIAPGSITQQREPTEMKVFLTVPCHVYQSGYWIL